MTCPAPGASVVEVPGVTPHDLVAPEAGGSSPVVERKTSVSGAGSVLTSRAGFPAGLRSGATAAGPRLIPFAAETDEWSPAEVEVPDPQVCDLLHRSAGVVDEQEQGAIS